MTYKPGKYVVELTSTDCDFFNQTKHSTVAVHQILHSYEEQPTSGEAYKQAYEDLSQASFHVCKENAELKYKIQVLEQALANKQPEPLKERRCEHVWDYSDLSMWAKCAKCGWQPKDQIYERCRRRDDKKPEPVKDEVEEWLQENSHKPHYEYWRNFANAIIAKVKREIGK